MTGMDEGSSETHGLRTISCAVAYEEGKARLRKARSPLHILVVEDDPVTVSLLRMLFTEKYCVAACGDVGSAVHEYMRTMPDVVFLDINLGNPHYSGLDVLHTLHHLDPYAHIAVITAHADAQTKEIASLAGAAKVITKPFSSSALLAYVAECEERKRLGKR